MFLNGQDRSLVEELFARTPQARPGSLRGRVQRVVMRTAAELDREGKLERTIGQRTVAQVLIEALVLGKSAVGLGDYYDFGK